MTYLEGLPTENYLTLCSHGLAKSLDKLRSFYLRYLSVCGHHQTWQGGKLHWEAPTHNFTHTFGHAVLPRSRDKLKQLYLYYQNVYGHQIRQGGGLPWGSPTHKVIWTFNTCSCEITQKTKPIIFLLTIPIVTKLVRVLNYYLRLPPLMSSDLLITWPTWCQMTNWRIYISTLTGLMVTKHGRALRRFSTQTLVFSFSTVFFGRIYKGFLLVSWIVSQDTCDQYRNNFIRHTRKLLLNIFHLIWNFVCGSMTCNLL